MFNWKATAIFALVWLSSLAAAEIATAPVLRNGGAPGYSADGVIEAVRSANIAAQTTGRITSLAVRAGDRVLAGQVLLRIDERIAADQLAASRAELDAASSEYERSKQLFAKQYISQAALDRATAQYKSLRAQANSSVTLTRYHTIEAPYSGLVSAVEVAEGDMAQPGRVLLRMYDPAALRAVVNVPESIVSTLRLNAPVSLEIPAAASTARSVLIAAMEVIPAADTATHAVEVRLSLPANQALLPGQFVRAQLPLTGRDSVGVLSIPLVAVVQRSEFTGVYVQNAQQKFQLRQIRLGRVSGARVDVLAGVSEGERVALDPLAAAKQ